MSDLSKLQINAFLKSIDVLVTTLNLKLQNYEKFEYAYLLQYLMYIMILHSKKGFN